MENVHAGYPGHILALPDPVQADCADALLGTDGCNSRGDSLPVGLHVVLPKQVQVRVAQDEVDAVIQKRVI